MKMNCGLALVFAFSSGISLVACDSALPNPGSVAQMRTRLMQDFAGPKTLVGDLQSVIGIGTRGGIGQNPP